MNYIKYSLILLFYILFNISCSKTVTPSEKPIVYISGAEIENSNYKPLYWKDGVKVFLPSHFSSVTTAIICTEHDILLSGFGYKNGVSIAKYWKNGTEIILSDGRYNTFAIDIASRNDSVFVVGYSSVRGYSIPLLWINGQEKVLPFSATAVEADVNSIKISGNDIYIGGSEINSFLEKFLVYWKNGNQLVISQANQIYKGIKIDVNQNKVYNVAEQYDNGKLGIGLWKNENLSSYFDHRYKAHPIDLVVNSSDLYILVDEVDSLFKHTPVIYKNFIRHPFKDSPFENTVTGLVVFNNESYVSGFELRNNHQIPKYWVNSEEYYFSSLSSNQNYITSDIFVINQ